MDEIVQKSWKPSWFGRAFTNSPAWTVEILEDCLKITVNGKTGVLPIFLYNKMNSLEGTIWSQIRVQMTDGKTLVLDGISNAHAHEMLESIRSTCRAFAVNVTDDVESKLQEWYQEYFSVLPSDAWIRHSHVLPLHAAAAQVRIHGATPREIAENRYLVDILRKNWSEHTRSLLMLAAHGVDAWVESKNRSFLHSELERHRQFFDTVESSALSEEQSQAVVCFDDRVLLVASAGSGKTSTLVSKVGYAIRRNIVQPEEVLLLAFNKSAAEEISERIRIRLAPHASGVDRVKARTFHAFGLDIIGEATGRKPTVAPWLDNELQQHKMLETIIEELQNEDAGFKERWNLYRIVFPRDISPFDNPVDPEDWDSATGNRGFRTLRGEVVKSQEERILANWLYFYGVNYVYEGSYEFETANTTHKQYTPDFYLTDAKAYLEHFALNKNGGAPAHFKDYISGVRWKRSLHEEKNTTLWETTSATVRSGEAFEYLKEKLSAAGVVLNPNPNRPVADYSAVLPTELLNTFRVFMRHAKGNRISMDQIEKSVDRGNAGFVLRQRLFIDIYKAIVTRWNGKLHEGGYIDFEDMINAATDYVESGRWKSPYRLVLVDEFQDVSRARARLLSALTEGKDRYLFCVGDDWQGIYRFAGSDIRVMTEFDQWFGKGTTRKLQKTYRCPQELCTKAGDFVMKNPEQFKKTVVTNNPIKSPVIRASCARSEEATWFHIGEWLRQLAQKTKAKLESNEREKKVTVFLLGRYRSDRPTQLDPWKREFSSLLQLEFHTYHGSKGLEADHVVMLNVINGYRGFPSLIEDDPILSLAMPMKETFPHAEERRLMYVALTRARQSVEIWTIEHRFSQFLIELLGSDGVGNVNIESTSGAKIKRCPKCRWGTLIRKDGRFGPFYGCSSFPACDHTKTMRSRR